MEIKELGPEKKQFEVPFSITPVIKESANITDSELKEINTTSSQGKGTWGKYKKKEKETKHTQCNICSKTFSRVCGLKDHMRTHEALKTNRNIEPIAKVAQKYFQGKIA